MNFSLFLVTALAALLAGSLVYCFLSMEAVRRYARIRPPSAADLPPISLLRPLHGADGETESNLRSCFLQDYPNFEIVAAVHDPEDAAIDVFEKVRAQFPAGPPARLCITGRPALPNAKAHSLERLVDEAQHDLLVMTDADVQLAPGALRALAAEMQDPAVGAITCPYRGVAGRSVWSRLEAIGMNTEFLSGVLVARMLESLDFTLGPTTAARREVIERVGGFRQLGNFLAEDFVLGQRAAREGYRVLLSSEVIEHRIGSQSFRQNLRHRLRWARSTRRSRPAGYWGQIFMNPLPLALLLCVADRRLWPLVILTVAIRGMAAWATSASALSFAMPAADWALLPIQDMLSLLVWVGGFFGNRIEWGGRTLTLRRDGQFEFPARGAEAAASEPDGLGAEIFTRIRRAFAGSPPD